MRRSNVGCERCISWRPHGHSLTGGTWSPILLPTLTHWSPVPRGWARGSLATRSAPSRRCCCGRSINEIATLIRSLGRTSCRLRMRSGTNWARPRLEDHLVRQKRRRIPSWKSYKGKNVGNGLAGVTTMPRPWACGILLCQCCLLLEGSDFHPRRF